MVTPSPLYLPTILSDGIAGSMPGIHAYRK
jgi:hypothetical protein